MEERAHDTSMGHLHIPAESMTFGRRFGLYTAFAAIYLIWGSTYLAIRITVETLPPFFAAGVRFLIAGALVFAVIPARQRVPLTRAHLLSAFAAGALMILGAYGATFWAEQTVPSGVTALIIATAPIWFMVLSARLEQKKPSSAGLAGIVLGLAGVVILLDPMKLSSEPVDPWGALALLLGAFAWARGSFYFRRGFTKDSAILGNALTMFIGGLLLALLSVSTREFVHLDLTAVSTRSWIALGYLIVFGSVVAFSAYAWLLREADPVKVSTYAFVNPVVAVLVGWLLAAEVMDLRIVFATLAIVAAVVLVLRSNPKKRNPRSHPGS